MDIALARRLASPQARPLLDLARATRDLAPHQRVERVRRETRDAELARAVLLQDDLRRRAAARCPHAERLLFTREALEQASAWPVATERAGRWPSVPPGPLTDLGAGIGFDALAAAAEGLEVVAYEKEPVRALLLRHNADALDLEGRLAVREEDVLVAGPDGPRAFLDPARRHGGRRTRDPAAFDPPVDGWAALLAPFETALVKLPPATPRPEEGFPLGREVPWEVVSLDGRARERRLFSGAWGPLPPRRALRLPSGDSVEGEGLPWPDPVVPHEGDGLLDPDPAVTLADLVGDLARQQGLRPLHSRIAYLVGPGSKAPLPGTFFVIEAILPPTPRAVEAWCRAEGVGRLTIRTRGVAADARDWHRRLRLPARAPGHATLVLTRRPDDRWVSLLGRGEEPGA